MGTASIWNSWSTSTALLLVEKFRFNLGTTEEYNNSANVITAGAWASGGSLPTSKI